MALDANSGQIITLEEAKVYVKAFRDKYPDEVHSFFVGSVNVEKILNQADCIGLRIYNGYDDAEKRMNLVLLGTDSAGNDMTNGIIVEKVLTCPPMCPPAASPLNM